MKAKKITSEEIDSLKVSSLPTRPNTPSSLGGRGYGPGDMKAAFDKLPMLLCERLNLLLGDIEAVGEGSLADAIQTGIDEDYTLCDLFDGIKDGKILDKISVEGRSLTLLLTEIIARLDALEGGKNE